MNKVLLTGRLTRDPEMRSLSSGKAVTQFSIATNEYIGQGKEKAEFQSTGKVYRAENPCQFGECSEAQAFTRLVRSGY